MLRKPSPRPAALLPHIQSIINKSTESAVLLISRFSFVYDNHKGKVITVERDVHFHFHLSVWQSSQSSLKQLFSFSSVHHGNGSTKGKHNFSRLIGNGCETRKISTSKICDYRLVDRIYIGACIRCTYTYVSFRVFCVLPCVFISIDRLRESINK